MWSQILLKFCLNLYMNAVFPKPNSFLTLHVLIFSVPVLLFGHPCRVLKGQFSTPNLLLAQVDVLSKLGYSI